MNSAYRSIFLSRIAAAIGAARATSEITHAGVKGAIREVLIRDLFRPLLPTDVGVGTGQIATSTGELSPQQDVIIYNRRILPPVLFEENVGIFPVESVLAIVEVKTTLTATELRSSYENAKVIQQFPYISGDRSTVNVESHSVKKAISTIFALSSDLAVGGKSELERLKDLYVGNDPPIRAICVSGRGYWFYTTEWCFIPSDDQHQETMSFIVGLIDTFFAVGLTRQQPGLVSYLMDNPPILGDAA
jgi:hypothetical protein